jgi:arylsulfatase A-like enzyme
VSRPPGLSDPERGAATPTPPAPEGRAPEGTPGWMLLAGQASVLALGIALFASVPTALRTARAGGSFLEGAALSAAVLLPLLALALGLARSARRGFRAIVGPGPHRAFSLGVAVWVGLAVPLLAGLAAVLKAATHHRGLGGTTYAVLGAVIAGLSALVAVRLVAFARVLVQRGLRSWIVAAAGAAIGTVPVVLVAATMAPGDGGAAAASVRAAILDGAIAFVATALVASIDLPARAARVAGTWGVPLAAAFVFGASFAAESSPELGRALRAGGGLSATLLGALERWTDRDGDGHGSHFGGGDCDDGDPARAPGLADAPGDGVDQDCDGLDGVAPRALSVAEAHAGEALAAPPAPSTPATVAPAAAPPPVAPAAPAAAPPAPSAAPPESAPPDIVLVTLDTVRADRTSAYGYAKGTTPRLAELAKRGALFERAYATGPDTQRALVPVVSGRTLAQTDRDRREWPTIRDEVDTLAERLSRAGYQTAAVTSFTWLSEERGFAQGFDRFETVYGLAHPERSITGRFASDAAKKILEDLANKSAPIFLWIHYFDAHELYQEHPGPRFGRGSSGLYDGEVAFVDQQLGALVDAVAAGPRAARTAWIVHGTHGEAFGEHDVVGHGEDLYDEVLRVPFVVVVPGVSPQRVASPAVSTLDVAPTALALAGAPLEGLAGVSLLGAAKGEPLTREPVRARSAKKTALVDYPLKLIRTKRPKKDRLLLFDLAADPRETKDLSAERPDDLSRLLGLLDREGGA